MRPTDEVKVMLVQELCRDLRPECEGDAPVVLSPAHRVLVRVRPQQIAEQALIWHVRRPHDPPDLLHRLKVRAEATVTAEDLLVDNGGHRETVEAVRESLPKLDVVAALACKEGQLPVLKKCTSTTVVVCVRYCEPISD